MMFGHEIADEMDRLEAIFHPYVHDSYKNKYPIWGVLNDDAPQFAVDAYNEYLKVIDKINEMEEMFTNWTITPVEKDE